MKLIKALPSQRFARRWSIAITASSVFLMVGLPIVFTPSSATATDVKNALEELDLPEEVLRSEILLDGRSSLDGKPLTATEYAELQSEIEAAIVVEPKVDSKLRTLVGLIKFRKFIKTVLPIVPIK